MVPEAAHPPSYVFLSYASADREKALQLADALKARGISVWIDRKSIAGGTSWSAEIVRGIRECSALLVACSSAAVSSPNVQQEIQLAWETRRPILPLLLEPVEFPDSIRYALAGRQWIDILACPTDIWLPLLLQALRGLEVPLAAVASTQPASPGPSADPRHPTSHRSTATSQLRSAASLAANARRPRSKAF